MKTKIKKAYMLKKIVSFIILITMIGSNFTFINITNAANNKIVFPIKQVAKLECRFTDFDKLGKDCKQNLPILKTKDYKKYLKLNGGYNDYTRYYTELWGASYKYGWDVGFGGHEGIDIASAKGTPIYSIADGIVINAKNMKGWGNIVTLEHFIEGRKVFSNYAHLSKILVKKGDKIKAGKKIGEMGSTGNSTGNHLHFQIDLDTPFHPYYYDYKTCPYSYYKITETGVCFNDLKANTIDPLLFLETKGEILKKTTSITTKKIKRLNNVIKVDNSSKNNNITKISINSDVSIFNKTVYIGYAKSDIREVQQILRDLKLYDGELTGDYNDILDKIIKYQLDKRLIKSKNDIGAGWFGPMTRGSLKKDYDSFIKKGGKRNLVRITDKYHKNVNSKYSYDTSNIKVQKIERKNILTRAEIEKREIDNFLKSNKININFSNVGGNIKKGQTESLKLSIIKKYKNKSYKGNTPLNITIQTNESILKVFPKKIFYFDNGEREIKLKGLKSGNTKVLIKLGGKILKTFKIKVYNSNEEIYPKTGAIYANNKIALGEKKRAIALFKDKNNKKLINLEYGSSYTLKGDGNVKVCLKSGSLKNIKKIYSRNCTDDEFKNQITFKYQDTVGGIVLFDYKAIGKNAKIKVINNYNNKILTQKNLIVGNPVDLKKSYVYHDNVVAMLKSDVINTETKGYFMQNKGLTEQIAQKWIEKSLEKIKSTTNNYNIKKKIHDKLLKLKKEKINKYKIITRKEFLEKAYNYLTLTNVEVSVTKKYLDLDDNLNKKANQIFGKNITWKDKFGENYFRPNIKITRGEAAYFLNQIFIKNNKYFLTLK